MIKSNPIHKHKNLNKLLIQDTKRLENELETIEKIINNKIKPSSKKLTKIQIDSKESKENQGNPQNRKNFNDLAKEKEIQRLEKLQIGLFSSKNHEKIRKNQENPMKNERKSEENEENKLEKDFFFNLTAENKKKVLGDCSEIFNFLKECNLSRYIFLFITEDITNIDEIAKIDSGFYIKNGFDQEKINRIQSKINEYLGYIEEKSHKNHSQTENM